jgi:hypothetical protein
VAEPKKSKKAFPAKRVEKVETKLAKEPKGGLATVRDIRQKLRDLTPKAIDRLESLIDDSGSPNAQVRAASIVLEYSIGKIAAVKLPEDRYLELVLEGVSEGLGQVIARAQGLGQGEQPDPALCQWAFDLIDGILKAKVAEIVKPDARSQDEPDSE